MIINIFTDASVNNQSHNAGYAFYIGCRGHKLQRAGVLKVKTKSTVQAELQAIINAVFILRRSNLPKPDKLVIHTDSMECIKMLTGVQQSPHDHGLRMQFEECQLLILDYMQFLCLPVYTYRKFVEFKHVKAHTGDKSKHSLINRWCDLESRRYRELQDEADGYRVKKRPNRR